MDVEATLIAKAVTTGEIEEVIVRNIEAHHFADEYIGDIYQFCCDFFIEHKQCPSMKAVKDEFPDFQPKLSKDPLKHHIDKFVKETKRRKAIELVRGYHDDLDDPDRVADIEVSAMEMARELIEVIPSPKAERLSEGGKRRNEYNRRKREGIDPGIKLGIPSYDELTQGQQRHELLIWGGAPGEGKTTGLQYGSTSAYMLDHTVLFISLEVEAEQILRRFDIMLAEEKIRYHALKALDLNDEEEREWDRILERCESERLQHDIIIRDDIRNCTPDKVAAEILRYKPDLVCVDYLEEMRSQRGVERWQAVEDNGRALKQIARVMKTPIATATQLNRQGETSYQSAQKIADILIILQPDDELRAKKEMKLMMRKYRDGESRKEAHMRWDLEFGAIHEKNYAERFPMRNNPSLVTRQRKLEQKIEVARIVAERDNPFVAKRNGHSKGNPWNRRTVSA